MKINCVHQLDYWEEKCPHCDGLDSCRVKPTPPEFQVRTAAGEITGKKRDELYRVFDSTIDTFLAKGTDDDETD